MQLSHVHSMNLKFKTSSLRSGILQHFGKFILANQRKQQLFEEFFFVKLNSTKINAAKTNFRQN